MASVTRTAKVPALLGKKDVADLLGVHSDNLGKIKGLPASLPGTGPKENTGPDGMRVTATPLWRRSEVEAFATGRARH